MIELSAQLAAFKAHFIFSKKTDNKSMNLIEGKKPNKLVIQVLELDIFFKKNEVNF